MATLLSLPQELLDEIIDLVILSPHSAPESPAEDTTPREIIVPAGCPGCLVLMPKIGSTYTPGHLGLLRTNKKLNQGTGARLQAAKKNLPYSFKLDMMIQEEKYLRPTWLHIPPTITHGKVIQELSVDLRCVGSTDHRGVLSGFRAAGNFGFGINWNLVSYLSNFMRFGFSDFRRFKDSELILRRPVRNLTFNVCNSTVAEGEQLAPEHLPISRLEWPENVPRDVPYVVHPKQLANWVVTFVERALFGNIPSWDIFRRVGKIKIIAEGEILKAWDMNDVRNTRGETHVMGNIM